MSEAASTAVAQSTNKSSSRLDHAARDLKFLYDPKANSGPTSRRTRTLLRTVRYIGVFLFWRLVRYAKYAAVGAVTAAIAGTAIGSVFSGAAFIIAPTGILGGAGVGLLWGIGKFGWRTLAKRIRSGDSGHADARTDEDSDDRTKRQEAEAVRPPRIDPW